MLILLIQLVLIALRLDCIVNWPWFLVFSPTLVTLVGFCVFGPPFSMYCYEVDPEEESEK